MISEKISSYIVNNNNNNNNTQEEQYALENDLRFQTAKFNFLEEHNNEKVIDNSFSEKEKLSSIIFVKYVSFLKEEGDNFEIINENVLEEMNNDKK